MKKKKSCHEIQSYEKKLYFSSLFRLMFRTNFSQNLKGGKTSFWKCICYLIFLSACLLRSFFLWRGGGGVKRERRRAPVAQGVSTKPNFSPANIGAPLEPHHIVMGVKNYSLSRRDLFFGRLPEQIRLLIHVLFH